MNKIERLFTDSTLLVAFVEIAECGNLTYAASRLNRSQSAISVQLRKLETELNTSLFLRQGKGMTLSADGETLLPVARRVLAELRQVQSLFKPPLNGRIRVGIPDDFDEGVLERALTDFTQSNPGVDVFATSGCTAGFPDAIQTGEMDIAVCSGPSIPAGGAFRAQKPVWVARDTMSIGLTDPVPLAIVNRGCWMGDLPKTVLDQHKRPYHIAFVCNGIMGLKAAIRAGFAIGILYEGNVEPGMRVLSVKDGFPALPTAHRSIMIRPDAPQDLAHAMADAIKKAA